MQRNQNRAIALWIALLLFAGAPTTLLAAEGPGKVNINTATAEQLAYLPRVGPAVAQRIVDHREANGRFKEAEELMLVPGIGEKTFELLEPYVSVSGETTLSQKVRLPAAGDGNGEGA